MRTYRALVAIAVLLASPALTLSQRPDNPTVRETLRWMQTSLQSGSGDYWVGHETRSVRLEDFAGCRVHFSASTHQESFANGKPATDKKPTRFDYFFSLGDIDPVNITFSKGPDNSTEVPSFITIRTRNDEKKITSRYSGQPEVGAKPDDTFVISFAVEAFDSDNDYVVRLAKAFKHAVEACGGKPSLFADSDRRDERTHTAPVGVAAQSALPRKDIPAIAKAANGAVVSIVMLDKHGEPIAQGTGFLVSKDGLVLTNYHVIETGSSAIVKLPDGVFFVVDGVFSSDKVRDVAVIKAHGQNFRTLALGNSDQLQVGEEVVAIGNPLSLESTVSNGIVSGIRTVEEQGCRFLQVTAPISPGSSGGPLFNMVGEVIGVTTLYLKGGENLNFAIPINDAKRLLGNPSAEVRGLPNETPESSPTPSEAPTPEASLDQKVACNKLAERSYDKHTIAYRHATDITYIPLFTSHIDAKSSTCFVIITETMKSRVSTGDESWILVTFDIVVYDALEDTVYAQLTQNWRGTDWVDQEELPSNGFVHPVNRDYTHSVLKQPKDGEKGLTWFRLALQKLLGIKL